jgi:hypothetical protein
VATRHSQVSTHPGYAVVTHRTTNVSPYRMIGTTSSKPRLEALGPEFTSPGGRILTFLPWCRRDVTKSKLQKVNTESKSLLACHLSKLLVLICALKCIPTVGFQKYGRQCRIILVRLWYQLWRPTLKQGRLVLIRIHTSCQHWIKSYYMSSWLTKELHREWSVRSLKHCRTETKILSLDDTRACISPIMRSPQRLLTRRAPNSLPSPRACH